MSGTNSNSPPGAGGGGDPSMEDILASIRRILAEDDPPPGAAAPDTVEQDAMEPPGEEDNVLVLDQSMRQPEAVEPVPAAPPPAAPPPAAAGPTGATGGAEAAPVVAKLTPVPTPPKPEPEEASLVPVDSVPFASPRPEVNELGSDASLEDAVRAAFEPAIKDWLDAALPRLAERMVRSEVERIVGGAVR